MKEFLENPDERKDHDSAMKNLTGYAITDYIKLSNLPGEFSTIEIRRREFTLNIADQKAPRIDNLYETGDYILHIEGETDFRDIHNQNKQMSERLYTYRLFLCLMGRIENPNDIDTSDSPAVTYLGKEVISMVLYARNSPQASGFIEEINTKNPHTKYTAIHLQSARVEDFQEYPNLLLPLIYYRVDYKELFPKLRETYNIYQRSLSKEKLIEFVKLIEVFYNLGRSDEDLLDVDSPGRQSRIFI